ncbi:MAG TPA: EB domain-containing protein, partial [Candidatus Polarisedimenticolia bacterium]|nr:EB domain-containing protein [Candidatus Polarisedimenticolia bacterium]
MALAVLATAPGAWRDAGAVSVIKGTSWFPIGPAPISPAFGGVASGRVAVVAVNPSNADDVWIGAASGGVWRTVNAGLDWVPISDSTEALAVGAIALDGCAGTGCSRIYVGTGENSLRRDTLHGRGLLVGTPNADQFPPYLWVLKGGTVFDLASIVKIALDPTTSGLTKRIYVAVSSGVTASATESTVTAPAPPLGFGIYQSDNNGDTWTKLAIPGTGSSKPTDLEMDPMNGNLLFAGFLGKGIFKGVRDPLTNTFTWCPLNSGTGTAVCGGTSGSLPDATTAPFDFVEIALKHNAGPNATLYAMFGNCTDPICYFCNPPIYKSTNGGGHWTLRNAAAPIGYSRYTHVLTIDPANDDHLFYGGLGLYRSLNSASNFDSDGNGTDDDMGSVPGNQLHPDQHDIVFASPGNGCVVQQCNVPGNNCRLYAVDDGGVYVSNDSGCTWTSRNDGLQVTGFQSIAASSLTARVLGGTQDNGTLMFAGSSTWAYKTGGDTNGTILDLDDGMKMYDVVQGGPLCSPERVVDRSTDGGSMWSVGFASGATEPAAFYPPLVQDPSPPHPLYFGTNRLYQGTTDGTGFVDVSGVLGGTGTFYADIQRTNVITAIGIAPSNPNRIYIGHYDGQIFVTSSPCPGLGCWTPVGGAAHGLPSSVPATWIAVDPSNADVAYVAFSGFYSGAHVYKTTNGGGLWTPAAGSGTTMLPSVPADSIAIEPSEPLNVWVGLDGNTTRKTVYRSSDGGVSWVPFGNGLPNAPVYELAIIEREVTPGNRVGQVFAATHGRGAFVLTQPFLTNYEGWVDGGIWDIPVYGSGFQANESCTMQILQSDGTICAQGAIDARGGTIQTDATGRLVTSNGGFYIDQQVAWGCFNGNCVNSTPIAECNDDANGDGIPDLVSTILVHCGGLTGIDKILGCPQQNNPPSSVLGLDQIVGGPVASVANAGAWGSTRAATNAVVAPPAGIAQAFQLLPAVQARDGSTRLLCAVTVPYTTGEADDAVLKRAAEAVNTDPECAQSGVAAQVSGSPGPDPEDIFAAARLSLSGPAVNGGELLVSLRGAPGSTTGTCFHFDNLGVPVANLLQILKLDFETAPGGALGGRVRLAESTPLGSCEIDVPTSPGESDAKIAAAVQAEFLAPGIPGPHPRCPANSNPRDFLVHGGRALVGVIVSGLTVCVDDAGVGFAVVPDETCFTDADCDDGNPCTKDACDTRTGVCVRSILPDGSSCDDKNPCTEGSVCRAGQCGVPVICNDGNLCTVDRCDPASG